MLKADLHIHSGASHDAYGGVDEILERAQEEGLDVLAVTDHDSIQKSLEAVREAPEYGLLALPGVEVSTGDGHLLAIGVDELPNPGKPLGETVDRVRRLGGVAVVPHPFQRTRHGAGAVTECDAVETFNSRLLMGIANRRAQRFADRHGIPGIAGSDAHTPTMVGRAYTLLDIDHEGGADDVLGAIRNGLTSVGGRRTPVMVSARQFMMNGGRRVAGSIWSVAGLL